ncbi:MAG TPA: hypothetical protein VEV16_13190 [Daejeonella sp.]|nr:hypothetical protein [Daejeonella sp.]
MTYQLFITHYRSDSNDARLWMYAKIFLSLLFFTTLGAIFKFGPILSFANVVGCMIFLIATIRYYNRRHRIPFVQIQDGTLNYFCPQQEEMVSISARDITKISTRFCELQLHTPDRIHSLNMGLVRQEQTRWEIKEMIRKMTAMA